MREHEAKGQFVFAQRKAQTPEYLDHPFIKRMSERDIYTRPRYDLVNFMAGRIITQKHGVIGAKELLQKSFEQLPARVVLTPGQLQLSSVRSHRVLAIPDQPSRDTIQHEIDLIDDHFGLGLDMRFEHLVLASCKRIEDARQMINGVETFMDEGHANLVFERPAAIVMEPRMRVPR